MTLLFAGPGLGAGHSECGVVGAGVGTKVLEPPRDKLEGRRLHREPAPHSCSFSTLALVTFIVKIVNWTLDVSPGLSHKIMLIILKGSKIQDSDCFILWSQWDEDSGIDINSLKSKL